MVKFIKHINDIYTHTHTHRSLYHQNFVTNLTRKRMCECAASTIIIYHLHLSYDPFSSLSLSLSIQTTNERCRYVTLSSSFLLNKVLWSVCLSVYHKKVSFLFKSKLLFFLFLTVMMNRIESTTFRLNFFFFSLLFL